ncbi:MAG: AbrB/MazE/SpoVT family DNA-binding domain-containing protein [Chroococcus sp. CMT-3BRIN-NPC107]|jgi:antitoxin MazE|nr:AbrB/MazE/SpoVT family DNA-binding domain-containing protein [Chroococcus sp. CMT-3BRIN-NPC107]
MASQVAKWGHSLGIRIPTLIAKQANLQEGTAITFYVVEGNIVIRPSENKL